ncbi:ATP-binding protein [Natronoflexus pectinivorans]|uniref:histidine kinase n=1 Tax=Natronoflexus pectinivorans TaxID=682526 RepID=A0A4R2GK33_9BACT|nr:ATP-binding protein [Natronoflexus pectinivorans]TCO08824.1 PAS domain S-box-containing protein [Natronoflexus pectinivorans]
MTEGITLYELIGAIPHPLIVIDNQIKVTYINQKARELLKLDSSKEYRVTPGLLLNCQNAIKLGSCGTTLVCSKCRFMDAIDHVLENQLPLKNQTGTIYTHESTGQSIWRLKFDCSFLNVNLGMALISLHDALFMPPSLKEISFSNPEESNEMKSNAHFDSKSELTESLLNSEACLNALLSNSEDALLILNRKNEILKWNSSLSKLINESEAILTHDLISRSLQFQFLVNTEFQCKTWEEIISNLDARKSFEGTIKTGHSHEIWVKLNIIPFYNEENIQTGTLLSFKDLSTEQNMRDQAMLHRYALEYFPAEFYYIHTDGRILYANKQARDILGIDSDLYSHLTVNDINPKIDQKWWHEHIKNLENDETLEFETLHKSEDGELYPVLVKIFMPDTDQPDLFCYYSHNLASHKSIENSLIKESYVNESLAEISRELTIHNDLNSVELLVRQYALQITESPFAFLAYRDPINQELKITIYSDSSNNYFNEVKIIEQFIAGHFNSSEPITEKEREISDRILNNTCELKVDETPLNQLIPFNRIASAGIFFNNEYKGLLLVAGRSTDYEEDDKEHLESLANLFALAINRIQEKQRLVESMEQLELAINVSNMAVWDIYPEKDEIIINPEWQKKLNISTENQHSRLSDVINLLHPEDMPNLLRGYEEHKNSNSPYFEIPCRVKIKNGTYKWMQGTGRIVTRTPDGRIHRIIGLATDNTDQVELNRQLLQSREEAIAANKAKSAFLARMSHEIRTPLNAIIGFADILKKNTEEPVQLDYLNNIKKSGMTLMNLISDILDYSKIEAGKLELNKNDTNLRNLINETQSLFKPLIDEKKLDFVTKISGNTPDFIRQDELRLRQILTNLVSNAIKFTEEGKIELIVSSETINDKTANISIKVIDTGIGIKPESQQKIFEDFTQQEDQDNRRYGGTGLGLGIVKRLLELMGGNIELQSEPEKGSTFTVYLHHCEIVNKKSINREDGEATNKITTQSVSETSKIHDTDIISEDCKNDCINELKPIWDEFSFRPSFGPVKEITKTMKQISLRHKDKFMEKLANRIDIATASFDVEELSKCIADFNSYSGINDYFG